MARVGVVDKNGSSGRRWTSQGSQRETLNCGLGSSDTITNTVRWRDEKGGRRKRHSVQEA